MTAQEVFDNWSAYLRPVDRPDFLKQLESVAQRPEARQTWIPVGERLPADDDRVLVAWHTQDHGIAMDVETGTACKALAHVHGDDPEDAFVTHWMPLPDAPSGPNSE